MVDLVRSQTEKAKQELVWRFTRHLSVCTPEEIYERYEPKALMAVEAIRNEKRPRSLSIQAYLENHNPIYYLAENVWFDNVRGDPRYLNESLHRDRLCAKCLAYIIEPTGTGFLWNSPRYTYKSTFFHGSCPMFCAFRWWLLHDTHIAQALVHHKDTLAHRNLKRLKAKYKHPWIKRFWPEFAWPKNKKKWGTGEEFTFEHVEEGRLSEPSFTAYGFTSVQTGGHFFIRWQDDIVTEEHKLYNKPREEARQRYEGNRYELELDQPREINSGTRYHINDLWATMIKATKRGEADYQITVIPAVDHEEPMQALKKLSEEELRPLLAHPGRLNAETLLRLAKEERGRTGQVVNWWLQMQNSLEGAGLKAFDPAWLKWTDVGSVPLKAWRCVFVDPAWKGTKNWQEGDEAALEVWAFMMVGDDIHKFFLHGMYSDEMSVYEGRNAIFDLMDEYHTASLLVEETGDYTFRGMIERYANKNGRFLDLIEPKSKQTKKKERMASFVGSAEDGTVWICKDATGMRLLVDQLEDWPQLEKDDRVDCAAYTMDPAIQIRLHGRKKKQEENTDPHRNLMDPRKQGVGKRTRYCRA